MIFLIWSCLVNIQSFENLVKEHIETVVSNVITRIDSNDPIFKTSAKARAGAEISDWLEEKFVAATAEHPLLKNSEGAPKGKTKNPWDARTFFTYGDYEEEIWIDFKAFKLSGEDSNPDIGTPDKIIKFIEEGGFYLLYVYVYYEQTATGLQFSSHNGAYTKVYFLKDISPTFRRTPTNQLQVNIDAQPVYRTREEFIDLLMQKIEEGLIRQSNKAQNKLTQIESKKASLKQKNIESENKIAELPSE